MDIYDSKPIDELEVDLLDETLSYHSIDTPQKHEYYQKIAQNSIGKKALVNDIIHDKEFESFAKTLVDNELSIKDTMHNFFYQVSHGLITPKELVGKMK